MFDIEIVRVRSFPMALQRRPHGSIIHHNLPPVARASGVIGVRLWPGDARRTNVRLVASPRP
jgi:hypothetical protein